MILWSDIDDMSSLQNQSQNMIEIVTSCNKDVIVEGRMNSSRRYDNCMFCKKLIQSSNFTRHIEKIHKLEKEVIDFVCQPKGSLERRRKIQLLRNLGNFNYNRKIFREGGSLLVVQSPIRDVNVSKGNNKYVCCRLCLGFYAKCDLCRHSCPTEKTNERYLSVKSTLFLPNTDPALEEFFEKLRNSEVSVTIRNDSLICQYIKQQLLRKGFKSYQMTSNQVRLVTLLLQEIRNLPGNKEMTLTELLTPENFDTLFQGILDMFQYNPMVSHDKNFTVSLRSPSSLVKLCQTIFKILETLQVCFLKKSLRKHSKKTSDVMTMFEKELRPIMMNASKSLKCATSGLPEELPDTKDIHTLKDKLMDLLMDAVNKDGTDNMRTIKEAALAFLIIFNKRRSSEVARLSKDSWMNRLKWKENALEEMEKLDSTERLLITNMEVVYVRGKGGKFVPILFPEIVASVVERLSKTCEKFIFENEAGTFIRGNDAVRNMAEFAGISSSGISSTRLRKLAATTLQLLNFNDVDYRVLCDHLGHTLPVHNRWYRLRNSTVELTKVAQILLDDFKARRAPARTEESNATSTEHLLPGPLRNESAMEENIPKKKLRTKRTQWTEQQSNFLRMRFAGKILSNTTLTKAEAEDAKKSVPTLFRQRSWIDIKNKVRNEALSRRRPGLPLLA